MRSLCRDEAFFDDSRGDVKLEIRGRGLFERRLRGKDRRGKSDH